jgi:phosphoribosylglycinamide formyltransferase 1
MMSRKNKLALLVHALGTQTNLKAIQKAVLQGNINAEIVAVVSDAEDALPVLEKFSPDYICLAGWKKIIRPDLVERYQNRILNIHPGLISDTKEGEVLNPDGTKALWNKGMYAGKAIQNFLDKKATYAGSSVHFLTSEFDFGPVLGRTFEQILPGDDVESLYARLKKKENELYVEVLEKLTKNE